MFRSNHMEPNKITVIGRVDQTLEQLVTKKNIEFGLKATCILAFNPRQYTSVDPQKYIL